MDKEIVHSCPLSCWSDSQHRQIKCKGMRESGCGDFPCESRIIVASPSPKAREEKKPSFRGRRRNGPDTAVEPVLLTQRRHPRALGPALRAPSRRTSTPDFSPAQLTEPQRDEAPFRLGGSKALRLTRALLSKDGSVQSTAHGEKLALDDPDHVCPLTQRSQAMRSTYGKESVALCSASAVPSEEPKQNEVGHTLSGPSATGQ